MNSFRCCCGSDNLQRSLRIQSVLYKLPRASVEKSLDYMAASVSLARRKGVLNEAVVAYGDCSPEPVLYAADLEELRTRHVNDFGIDYTFFGGNLGSAAGHNRLLANASSDTILIANPDVLASPRLLVEMFASLAMPEVGFVEGRQLPVEHHKHYDQASGETSWGSTACLLGERTLFEALEGFDSKTFFLYCDDVDLSWRARLLGKKVIHCPQAVVFHDKRLNDQGGWMASAAERYYSAEAGLLLSYKFSRPDLTENFLSYFRGSNDPDLQKAAENFNMRRQQNQLPTPLDLDHVVGQFIDGGYALSRFNPR